MSVFGDLDKLVKNNGNTQANNKRREQFKKNMKEAAGIKSTVEPQPKSNVASYVYKDSKKTNDWDLDRIRTFIKTEINDEPNGDPEQIWYNVDYGENQSQGRFYALKCHLGTKKQKTIKKAYSVDELVTYFFGPISEDDFNGYSQYPETWANRSMIWSNYYSRRAWVLHLNGGIKQVVKQTQVEPKKTKGLSLFEHLEVANETVYEPIQPKDTIKEKLQPYSKRLLSAIIQQISNGYFYADPYINGAEPVLNSIDKKYLPDDVKEAILDIKDVKYELAIMIDKAAEALGKKMPVYEAGQRSKDSEPGDRGYEVYYSTDKKLVYDWVKELVKDMNEVNKDSDTLKSLGFSTYEDYLKDELDRVYCIRIF